MYFLNIFTVLSTVTVVLGAPAAPAAPFYLPTTLKSSGCPLTNATLSLPPNQNVLAPPNGVPIYVTLGVGVQNYTCGATGKFASAGAVARLFDISCLVNTPFFAGIQDMAYAATKSAKGQDIVGKVQAVLHSCAEPLGVHYHIRNGTDKITPVFDFRGASMKGDATAVIRTNAPQGLPSPAGSSNVDWLMLHNIGGEIGGSLASTVYRVDTKAGKPPASCTPNQTLSVPYATKYWLFK